MPLSQEKKQMEAAQCILGIMEMSGRCHDRSCKDPRVMGGDPEQDGDPASILRCLAMWLCRRYGDNFNPVERRMPLIICCPISLPCQSGRSISGPQPPPPTCHTELECVPFSL